MKEVFVKDAVAVITGAASGIGAAAARLFASRGMKLALFDLEETKLTELAGELKTDVRVVAGDVARMGDIERLRDEAFATFGRVDLLMNNAAISGQEDKSWSGIEAWRRVLDINLWGVINGTHAFAPAMISQAGPSAIVNTGSKQGITNPPGHPAYAVAKAGVRTLTEQLQHELREETGARVSAHLLVPGWTFTGMTRGSGSAKPAGAWTADQVVDLMVERVSKGDFYIVCPDNTVSPALDAARIRWGAEDVAQNRPALSRWHPDWKEQFDTFTKGL
ncbi:SDR family NAD(P)-dependent oxidoreductase [Caballeronia sp. LZ008]|uniref:SDR family NAD(P)-dependent oxidoreductase n=1 Tax=unclassified Caballeronia TaxID=2646786 RepID=UPI0020278353|nr:MULTISPECIES: SDR family NAD(P)-dependent oxidoreductase [unclassified Caballeronia]MDR5798174.1 SDR family NAD(P)-dependent oxidoreductase [Caballeronia sp. LZ008]